jgi:hypothetical protein
MTTVLFSLLLTAKITALVTPHEIPAWQPVELKREITHPQPMTGLVLWHETARRLHDSYGQTIQLEFSYCLPCKVVTGCREDGTVEYDWSWFDRILDDVASRGHQLIARFRYEYPSNRDVDGQPGTTAVPDYIKQHHLIIKNVVGTMRELHADIHGVVHEPQAR